MREGDTQPDRGHAAQKQELRRPLRNRKELTPRRLSHEAVRQAVKRLGHGWKRAKQWITSPDPAYARKKKRGTG